MSHLNLSAVEGCPGWRYGLRIRSADGTLTFDVVHENGRYIAGLESGPYRTTELALSMGDERPGYEDVARAAVLAEQEKEQQPE